MSLASQPQSAPVEPRRESSGNRGSLSLVRRIIVPLVIVAGLGFAAWRVALYAGLFAGSAAEHHMIHEVKRGDLVITVTEDGNVESAANIDVRCQVFGGGTIRNIVLDGTFAKQGELLVEIDSSAIDEQILTQRIAYEKARAIRDQAQNDLVAAKITLREYVEGTYLKDLQLVESQVTVAQENLRSAQNTLDYTERMFRKGYVTPLQLESQQFGVKRAQLDLDAANTAKRVLRDFTFEKMKKDLETKVSTAEAKSSSEQAAYDLEVSKLKRLETQKANCTIEAPQAGMVVYANESSGSRFGGSSAPKIEEGAVVRESQVILRLPDLAQMQVKVTVHESKVESLRIGMPASIRIQNRKLTGYVTSIANQPETTMMFSAGVKEYAAYVRIDGEQTDLKPGMTAEVEILVDERKNVLTIPVQCVIEQAGKFYCFKMNGDAVQKTEITLGAGDDKSVEIRSGLVEGDKVLQNPLEKSEGSFSGSGDSRAQFGKGKGKKGSGGGKDGAKPGADGPAADAKTTSSEGAKPGPGAAGGNLMQFDKDGDGKVGRDEAPSQIQAFFDKIDTNADGFISAAEAQAARAKMQGAGGASPGPAAPAGAGGNQ